MSTSPVAKAVATTHIYPNFYACYLLRSLKKKYTSRTYVGSTPNPARRIRQHNGELTAGAKKTARYRPWEMVCIVYGFPSQLSALQFEWAWQNPHISRQMPQATKAVLHRTREDRETSPGQRRRGAKNKNRRLRPSLTMAGKLANMHSMLTLDAWHRWPLRVKIFSEDVWQAWNKHVSKKGVPSLPPWITAELDLERAALKDIGSPVERVPVDNAPQAGETGLQKKRISKGEAAAAAKAKAKADKIKATETAGGVTNLDILDRALRDEQTATLAHLQALSPQDLKCCICHGSIDGRSHTTFIVCPDSHCHHLSHTACLARTFTTEEPDALLPTRGTCPGCAASQDWGRLVKGSHFRHLLHVKGAVDVDEDEFADLEMDGQSDSDSSPSSSTSTDEESLMSLAPAKKGKSSPQKKEQKITAGMLAQPKSPELLIID